MSKSPGNRKGSNHSFSLTWHREALRGYCIACSNYRVLFGYLDCKHYCGTCKGRINAALKNRKRNPLQVDKQTLETQIDEIVGDIQKETADERKYTERHFRFDTQKWKPLR